MIAVTQLLLWGLVALIGLAQPRGRAGHVARTVEWAELVLVGFNDDEMSRGSNLAEVLASNPDVIFIQEGRAADYRRLRDSQTGEKLLPMHTWGVHQDTRTPARAGSVIIFRHLRSMRTGAGFAFGVKARGLMARWIAWLRCLIPGPGGRRSFLFSAHRPPLRDRRWWQPFDTALWARLRLALAAGRLVLGQMDSNQHGGPPRLPSTLRWVASGNSIDGFVLSREIRIVEGPIELPTNTSDHHPILLAVHIPLTRRTHR